MNYSQRLVTGFSLFIFSIASFLILYFFYASQSSNKTELKDNTQNFLPEKKLDLRGKVNGEISAVKFKKNLQASLITQDTPKIWLEFTNEKNETQKVELPKQILEIIKKRWQRTLYYSDQHLSASDREEKIAINKNYLNDAAVFATAIDDFQITTPFEKRKISTDESFAIVSLTADFAIERYKQLKNIDSQIKPQKISQ